jgi:hypothetical protein
MPTRHRDRPSRQLGSPQILGAKTSVVHVTERLQQDRRFDRGLVDSHEGRAWDHVMRRVRCAVAWMPAAVTVPLPHLIHY